MYKIVICTLLLTLGLSGCEKEGPAEKMGKSLDKAVEEVTESVDNQGPAEKVGESLDQATTDAQQALQKAGESLGDAMKEAGRKIEQQTGN